LGSTGVLAASSIGHVVEMQWIERQPDRYPPFGRKGEHAEFLDDDASLIKQRNHLEPHKPLGGEVISGHALNGLANNRAVGDVSENRLTHCVCQVVPGTREELIQVRILLNDEIHRSSTLAHVLAQVTRGIFFYSLDASRRTKVQFCRVRDHPDNRSSPGIINPLLVENPWRIVQWSANEDHMEVQRHSTRVHEAFHLHFSYRDDEWRHPRAHQLLPKGLHKPPEEEPEDEDPKEFVVTGAVALCVVDASTAKATEIAQSNGPNIWAPRLGYVRFKYITNRGEEVWGTDIAVKGTNFATEAPDLGIKCIGAVLNTEKGVTGELILLRKKRTAGCC